MPQQDPESVDAAPLGRCELPRESPFVAVTSEQVGRAAAAESARPPDLPPAWRRLEAQGLFIFGCARSGTTILARCLNRAPRIHMLEESDLWLNQQVEDFPTFFNDKHQAMGNEWLKGTFVPPAAKEETGPLATFVRLAERHRYVGEKLAFGPHFYEPDWRRQCLEFYTRLFWQSRYLLLVRQPAESLWSMQKMFPQRPLAAVFQIWCDALSLLIDIYCVCPQARFVFFEHVDRRLLWQLAWMLRAPLWVPRGTLGGAHVHSRVGADEMPEILAPYGDLCGACQDVYAILRHSISRRTLRWRGAGGPWDFFNDLRARLAALRDRAAEEVQEDAAPGEPNERLVPTTAASLPANPVFAA